MLRVNVSYYNPGMSLADKIRKRGVRKLAAEVGVEPSHISMILNGKRSPSLRLAVKISGALKTNVSELLSHVESVRASRQAA